jgi:DNA polymerase III subunit epsilon
MPRRPGRLAALRPGHLAGARPGPVTAQEPGRRAGPAAGEHWRRAEYCVIDVETTGLNLRRDDVISVGLVPVRGGRITVADSYYRLVRPRRAPSPRSIVVHGLRDADLAAAAPAAEVAAELGGLLAGQVVVAHAAWIERAFLSRLLRQAGGAFAAPVIDTAALARCLGEAPVPARGQEPSLELLARQLGLPVYRPHHALGDAVTTAAVFLALATRAEQDGLRPGTGRLSLGSLLAMSARHEM